MFQSKVLLPSTIDISSLSGEEQENNINVTGRNDMKLEKYLETHLKMSRYNVGVMKVIWTAQRNKCKLPLAKRKNKI